MILSGGFRLVIKGFYLRNKKQKFYLLCNLVFILEISSMPDKYEKLGNLPQETFISDLLKMSRADMEVSLQVTE